MTRKITLLTFIFALMSITGFSQKRVAAEDILRDIKAGKDISISNATIEGILDFTFMEEQLDKLPRKKARRNRDNTVKYVVKSQVSFTNCTFKNHVLAYIPDGDGSGYTFIANFDNKAIFKNCTFERKAMFKHSVFAEGANFDDSEFQGSTTFKHAIFDNSASFKSTEFENEATFKHAIFKKSISFEKSIFEENVTLKHAIFQDGLSLKGVQFQGSLDMKHTNIKGSFDMSGMKVTNNIDSKHTMINGRSFTTYLLNNR